MNACGRSRSVRAVREQTSSNCCHNNHSFSFRHKEKSKLDFECLCGNFDLATGVNYEVNC